MTKLQKAEWISLVGLCLSAAFVSIMALLNMDIFGTEDATPVEVFSYILFFAFAAVFAILYIVKIVVAIKNGKDGLKIPLFWGWGPIAIGVLAANLVNGATPFSDTFAYLTPFTVVGVVLTCVLINAYFFFFWGKKDIMALTWVIYTIGVWVIAVKEGDIAYIHNYYLVFLIPALAVGYLEFFIRKKMEK